MIILYWDVYSYTLLCIILEYIYISNFLGYACHFESLRRHQRRGTLQATDTEGALCGFKVEKGGVRRGGESEWVSEWRMCLGGGVYTHT